ncbi:MAG: TatD family hydrolase [Petrimonas sp.]|uniref:TatD family hydrolase n=1 Tax=Petrimonas sp. TaxID=2023866 RepID=UPI002B3B1789|nr:TatD family hydrolase [Petrimonas sp.]MEA4995181.1 TatD family hydrolase [Petrimonas sp.]MEA5046459.1 TatD family hydrolase [Petrimonas sp.]
MKIVDTHAHLYLDAFDNDLDDVVVRARAIGVEKILLPNIDETTVSDLKQTVDRYPSFFIPMMGLHPTNVREDWEQQLEIIYDELSRPGYIAVGEIGIDLYWDKSSKERQVAAFERQLGWSIEKKLPVTIHSREAIPEVIQSIKKIGKKELSGVFHSFGGSMNELKEILELGNFYIGINGVVTFKKSGLDETLKNCGLENIILETDSPYLAPVPYRGKRNEPTYLSEIVKKLSAIYRKTEEEITQITTRNAYRLFNIAY